MIFNSTNSPIKLIKIIYIIQCCIYYFYYYKLLFIYMSTKKTYKNFKKN
uniref:ATP synthase F0 subunit 8 n=1 Tax=Hypera postica TaxID=36757 RepID=J9PIU4_9CUCU|nr:ATP synthase F0 subunit 8 [Hypera postica]